MADPVMKEAMHDTEGLGGKTAYREGAIAGEGGETKRGLKSRHIQFLALGGAIGTGLFIGSGAILSLVGPAPLFMGYISNMGTVLSADEDDDKNVKITGLTYHSQAIVYVVMNVLAEMVTFLPMSGITVPYFVGRFVDRSLAFATGWNYWYAYAILVAAEATAGSIILSYWNADINPAVWITIILITILLLNIIAVPFFGESEFWFASIKLITIIGLIIVGIVLFFGGGPAQNSRLGFRYWKDPGAFNPYLVSGNTGKFLAYWTAFVRAGFAFITSPELIALAAGETVAPRRNIPKAARRFIWRLAIFYGIASLVIGVIVPSNDPRLLSPDSNASASPFVIGIQNAGIPVLNHVINAAVLTSAWSAGNAFLFSGSRTLYGLALTNQAPKFLSKTNRYGVPWPAILATWTFGLLAYLNVSNSGAQVFTWFSNLSTISGFIGWIVCLITYLRFRRALVFNNALQSLPYATPFQPYASYAALAILIILTLTNGFHVFFPANWSAANFLAAYITLPIFLVLYLGHKGWASWKGKTAFTSFAIKISEIDVVTGKREMDELEARWPEPVAENWWQRVWYWVA